MIALPETASQAKAVTTVEVEGTKTCGHCRLILPFSAFKRHPHGLGGVFYRCRPCDRKYMLAWRAAAKEKAKTEERTSTVVRKNCTKCKETKPADEFWRASAGGSADGLNAYCKSCSRTYATEHRKVKYITVIPVLVTSKTCRRCKEEKPVAQFYASKQNRDGLSGYCRKCHIRSVRESYHRNPEPAKNRATEHKAKKLAVADEKVDRRIVFRRDDGVCYLCLRNIAYKDMHLDHVIPLSRGGRHNYDNCATTCGPCNLRKSDYLLEELDLGDFSQCSTGSTAAAFALTPSGKSPFSWPVLVDPSLSLMMHY